MVGLHTGDGVLALQRHRPLRHEGSQLLTTLWFVVSKLFVAAVHDPSLVIRHRVPLCHMPLFETICAPKMLEFICDWVVRRVQTCCWRIETDESSARQVSTSHAFYFASGFKSAVHHALVAQLHKHDLDCRLLVVHDLEQRALPLPISLLVDKGVCEGMRCGLDLQLRARIKLAGCTV